jgi:hypothetical protein
MSDWQMKRTAAAIIGLAIFVSIAFAQEDRPIIACKMNIVPSLLGMSYQQAEQKWREAGFESPVFPNRWCIDQQHCALVVWEQSLTPGTACCFYSPIGVIMYDP